MRFQSKTFINQCRRKHYYSVCEIICRFFCFFFFFCAPQTKIQGGHIHLLNSLCAQFYPTDSYFNSKCMSKTFNLSKNLFFTNFFLRGSKRDVKKFNLYIFFQLKCIFRLLKLRIFS